jgi:hypothetical protein
VIKARGDLVTLLEGLVKSIQQGEGAARARAIVQAAHREIEHATAAAESCKDPVKKGLILVRICTFVDSHSDNDFFVARQV